MGAATITVVSLGRTDYGRCWELQRTLLERRRDGSAGDILLLTEHDPVYTIGTSGDANHLLASAQELAQKGITVVHTDRGGDITYHGPGQLVGYPILDLHGYYLDLHRYLRDIEETVIRTLRRFRIEGERMAEYTGVWVGGEKICAIGIRSSRWVTMHGFALNVGTDLSMFQRIIPCGIFERGVTSMREVLGREVDTNEVAGGIVEEFGAVFGADVVPGDVRIMHQHIT